MIKIDFYIEKIDFLCYNIKKSTYYSGFIDKFIAKIDIQ